MQGCIFCEKFDREIITENKLVMAFYDLFPVNKGHTLIVPKRHFESFFDAFPEELVAISNLIFEVKNILYDKYKPDGFNIGVNVGSAGGQTVFHMHVHLIPRYIGDVKDPSGGIRNVKKSLVPY